MKKLRTFKPVRGPSPRRMAKFQSRIREASELKAFINQGLLAADPWGYLSPYEAHDRVADSSRGAALHPWQ